jgi:hypothetical protein
MKRLLLPFAAFVVMLLGAANAAANEGPPRPKPVEPNTAIAAIAGSAGAVLAGYWFIRKPKP